MELERNFLDITEGSAVRDIIDEQLFLIPLLSYEAQNLGFFNSSAIEGFSGWWASPWYMNYNVDFWPWIYHDEHGWQYIHEGSTGDVIFLWDYGLGKWVFFNEISYRWIYLFGDGQGWVFTFGDNTPDRRFFQRLDNGSLFSVPENLPAN